MKKIDNELKTGRRDLMKMLAFGSVGLLGGPMMSRAETTGISQSYKAGMPPVKIKSVKAIACAPENRSLTSALKRAHDLLLLIA